MPAKSIDRTERQAICGQAIALAKRADAAGMPISAFILEIIALEADPLSGQMLDVGNKPDRGGA
ncbi:MAG: hypothetical protein ABI830_06500 [Pseudolabrys sp.]